MDYLKAVCEKLDVDPERVVKQRVQGDEFVVIVDNGIAGCPKYVVPLADLTVEPEAIEVESETEESPNDAVVLDDPVTFYRELEEEEPPADIDATKVNNVVVVVDEVLPDTFYREEATATDSARDLAFEHGIDIRTVQGSGAGGRIVKKDVEALL